MVKSNYRFHPTHGKHLLSEIVLLDGFITFMNFQFKLSLMDIRPILALRESSIGVEGTGTFLLLIAMLAL